MSTLHAFLVRRNICTFFFRLGKIDCIPHFQIKIMSYKNILWNSMTSTSFVFTELANTMDYGGGFLYNLIFTEWCHCVSQNEVWGRGCYITLISPSDVTAFHRMLHAFLVRRKICTLFSGSGKLIVSKIVAPWVIKFWAMSKYLLALESYCQRLSHGPMHQRALDRYGRFFYLFFILFQ